MFLFSNFDLKSVIKNWNAKPVSVTDLLSFWGKFNVGDLSLTYFWCCDPTVDD